MSQMPCSRCGTLLPGNQRFCPNCGAAVTNVAASGISIAGAPPANMQVPQPPPFPGQPAQPPAFPAQPAQGQHIPSHQQSAPFAQGQHIPSHQQPAHYSGQYQPQQLHGQPPTTTVEGQAQHGYQATAGQQQQPQFPGQPQHPQQTHGQMPTTNVTGHPQHALNAAQGHLPGPHIAQHAARLLHPKSVAPRLFGLFNRTTSLIAAAAVVVVGGTAAGLAYVQARSTAPTSYVIATDFGGNQIDRIDLATRKTTILLSNKVLPSAPDSAVFIGDTKMLVDFPNTGEIGIADIQNNTYSSVTKRPGTILRDMALRADSSGVLIADTETGTVLEFHVADHSITTFARNVGGVQGLAFSPDGSLYAMTGGTVTQLDPATGQQIKTFNLPGGSDGMSYDQHRNTLDIASGNTIITLDPKTGAISTLLSSIGTADGVAIDRQGNLFIASSIGILELTVGNQLLIIGLNTPGVQWDDVAPLSGNGAVAY